ncbi:serine/threonine-protein kinase [Actinomadura parmotrematis]|uniref:Serine/threonine protein kinase n=1 Tax=Actinomadura parmotrematis TaxID=2864039 RepID=A0ABS7FR06_9ACTN|nr:serine/threonine-protein kinase [Actinomadura parmotrematis]MBW8482838.1 serine/threonine protein kinase [Actinomadura parmotrematis]
MRQRESLLEALGAHDPGSVGPYALLGRLGAGSMGRVYLGRSAAGRLVAVKTIRAELARDGDFRVRFGHEATAARRVSGVYTASVVAADTEAEVPWLATAYVPAPSLERLVQVAGPLPVQAVRWIAACCAEALESIHAAGLVHRDLKPSNVLVSLDGPRVIDFGLSHASERARVTVSRVAIGTPAYMAPEQAEGSREVTAASDVYALGATLLYAATGHGPYPGEGVLELMAQLATRSPDLADLPLELDALVRSCLDRDPRRRPSPARVLDALSPSLTANSGADPGLSYLPPAALELVQEYREGPRLEGAETEPFRPRETAPHKVTPPRRKRRPSESSAVGAFLREPRNRLASALAVVAVGFVVVLGHLLWTGARGGAPREVRVTETVRTVVGGRPPEGPPPAPVSGESARPTGRPKITVNQPRGDRRTIFVVHGTGWTPGAVVMIKVDRLPYRRGPSVDRTGTFNYAVNQDGASYPAGMPLGRHKVSVRPEKGGTTRSAQFDVVPGPGAAP